jgi:hypothetical protein
MSKFKFYAIDGMDEREIGKADSIKLVCDDGQIFELSPRKSDGEITIYTRGRLVIEPQASNCVRIHDRRI